MIPGRAYSGAYMIPGRSWQDQSKEICKICMVPLYGQIMIGLVGNPGMVPEGAFKFSQWMDSFCNTWYVYQSFRFVRNCAMLLFSAHI